MNIVYFGSPDFSADILKALIKEKYKIIGVVTNPDKPQGRKQILTPTPVAQVAAKYDLPLFKPAKLEEASAKGRSAPGGNLAHLKLGKPDIFLVVAYGKIVPRSYLDTPSLGTFNIHFSLLPKYRGALPISESIRNGDQETGVTLMQMDDKLDHGSIISQVKIAIDINDNCESLTNKLTQAAIDLLKSKILNLKSQISHPQDESLATYTPSIKTRNRQSAFIDWETIKQATEGTDAPSIHNLIRSLNPDPGAWTKINGLEIRIIKTSLENYLEFENCKLKIDLVQIPGKSPITWQKFTSGHPTT